MRIVEKSENLRENKAISAASPLKRALLILSALAVIGVFAYVPIMRAAFALRLTLSLASLAAGGNAEDLPVLQEKISRQLGGRNLESLVYHASRSTPDRALLLVPGVSELGCYHPRLVALSRSLAGQGFMVITPDIRMFREFRIEPEALDEITFWFEQVKTFPSGDHIRRLGLGGISFSGTLALIAAARQQIRERVAYVLAIGPYDDPLRCAQTWFAAGLVTVGKGYFPTRFYAKWIIMMAALDMLPDAREREFLRSVLHALLLQKRIPEPIPAISAQALRWYRLAVMREDQSDPQLARQMEEYLTPRLYKSLMPDKAASEIRCPVFLVHGAYDDLIPPEESIRLSAQLSGAKTYLLISPFLTHTHPLEQKLGLRQKAAGLLDILGFLYHFADVTSKTGTTGPFSYS